MLLNSSVILYKSSFLFSFLYEKCHMKKKIKPRPLKSLRSFLCVCVCVFGVYLCVRKKVCVSLFLFYFPFILSESRFISVLHFQYLCLWFVVTETTCTHTVLDFCFRCITVKVHTHTHTHTVDRVCVGVMQWSQCTISCSSQPGMKPHHRPCGCSEDTHTHKQILP